MIGFQGFAAAFLVIVVVVLLMRLRHVVGRVKFHQWRVDRRDDTIVRLQADVRAKAEKCAVTAGERDMARVALSKSDAENAALRSELAELKTYAEGVKAENESLKRTSAPAAKKNLPPKIVGRKAKR